MKKIKNKSSRKLCNVYGIAQDDEKKKLKQKRKKDRKKKR